MQFKWWGRGKVSSLHASHCSVLGEQERGIISCGAQLSVPQHQCSSESDAGEAKTPSLSICEINLLWAAVESCLGYRWPREPEFALPVLFFLLQVLQCSCTVIKMWNLCICNEMSYLIDAGAVTIQARLKVTTTHLTVWKFSIHLCCPLAVGRLPFLDFWFSSLWSRYHTFCSFTLLNFEFLMEK